MHGDVAGHWALNLMAGHWAVDLGEGHTYQVCATLASQCAVVEAWK